MIDFKTAGIDECAWHFSKCSRQAVYAALYYYKELDSNVYDKLVKAKRLSKSYRVLIKARQIEEEILNGGLINEDHPFISSNEVGN